MSNVRQYQFWNHAVDLDGTRLPVVPTGVDDRQAAADIPASPNLGERHPGAHDRETTPDLTPDRSGPPLAWPLAEAVAAGMFGREVSDAGELDMDQVAGLTSEHANELIGLLGEIDVLQEAIRTGSDPRTGRRYRDAQAATAAAERHHAERQRLETSYNDALAAFADGFGAEATHRLDEWVRAEVAGGTHKHGGYEPGHPWHYYLAGDNAPPVPFEQIPPCEEAGGWLARNLPKHPAKRLAKMRELLEREKEQLAADRERYQDLILRGAVALSRFDREIAHGGNDELARASALALKFNHIRQRLGRVQCLQRALGHDLPLDRPNPARAAHVPD